MRQLCLSALILLLTACATPSQTPGKNATQWIGANKQALLKAWGLPNGLQTLANGRTEYQYVSNLNQPPSPPPPSTQVIVAGPSGKPIGYQIPTGLPRPLVTRCMTTFEITKDDIVASVRQSGAGCSQSP